MKSTPLTFDKILNGDLQPWLEENKQDESFTPLLKETKLTVPEFQNHYEINFIRPFNSKTKYYERTILNESNHYCLKLLSLLSEDSNPLVRKYWINDILNKKLKSRLTRIGELIKEEDYSLNHIIGSNIQFNQDTKHKTNTFIIQLLKQAFIKCYLEIQEVYSIDIDDILIEEDFYSQILYEITPNKSFIKKVEQIEINLPQQKEAIPIEVAQTKQVEFNPIQSDFKGTGVSPVNYSDIRKPDIFSKFEIELYESSIIDEKYNFIKAKGNKNILAAAYKILINKNYFRKSNTNNGKPFEPFHFRQYLDHRYSTDTTQQFKKCKTAQIESIKHKHMWVDNIDYCR